MLIKIVCSSCGSGDIIVDENSQGEEIIICKNPKCDDFNCFDYLYNAEYEIIEGLTGSQTFKTEEGNFKETYKNGKITEVIKY